MTDPVIAAAAYLLLLGQPVQAPVPSAVAMPRPLQCQLTMDMNPAPVQGTHHVRVDRGANANNHLTVRWVGNRQQAHHRRHRRHRP